HALLGTLGGLLPVLGAIAALNAPGILRGAGVPRGVGVGIGAIICGVVDRTAGTGGLLRRGGPLVGRGAVLLGTQLGRGVVGRDLVAAGDIGTAVVHSWSSGGILDQRVGRCASVLAATRSRARLLLRAALVQRGGDGLLVRCALLGRPGFLGLASFLLRLGASSAGTLELLLVGELLAAAVLAHRLHADLR